MQILLAIAAGGAAGALIRHGVNNGIQHWIGAGFPYGILTCNVAGSFLMGLLIAVFAHFWDPPQSLKAFLTVGMLGAFTTFSTFSLDAALMIERNEYTAAAIYVIVSVLLSVGALFGGLHVIRMFL